MSISLRMSRLATTPIVLVALVGTLFSGSGPSFADPAELSAGQQPESTSIVDACVAPTTGRATCQVQVVADSAGRPLAVDDIGPNAPAPFTAADLQDAYDLPSALLGSRQTIAVIGMFGYPTAAANLAVYRQENNLPACTDAFPCFRKVNQRGGSESPPANRNGAVSSAASLQVASAACPNCLLLLVEADDGTPANVAAAVDQAVTQGADVITLTSAYVESVETAALAEHYDHLGVVITAPSGNTGFGIGAVQLMPAAYPTVVAVGGTSLTRDDATARGWTERAWFGSTSGCSAYVAKPAWQRDSLCSTRTVADVAAVADPATPIAIYDTFGFGGWVTVGGTSLSAALVAGVYALAGNADAVDAGRHMYRQSRQLNDVTAGLTGSCGGSYLCTAGPGYDGPTGLGTPRGIGAF